MVFHSQILLPNCFRSRTINLGKKSSPSICSGMKNVSYTAAKRSNKTQHRDSRNSTLAWNFLRSPERLATRRWRRSARSTRTNSELCMQKSRPPSSESTSSSTRPKQSGWMDWSILGLRFSALCSAINRAVGRGPPRLFGILRVQPTKGATFPGPKRLSMSWSYRRMRWNASASLMSRESNEIIRLKTWC